MFNKKKSGYTSIYRQRVYHPLVEITLHGRCINGRIVIIAVNLGKKELRKEKKYFVPAHPDFVKYGRMIRGFLDGSVKDLSPMPVDMSQCSGFSKKVLRIARSIPWGKTVSYARLALMAGHPNAVRAVASVLRNNPLPLIIPCHRVIKSDGSIGGFMGKTKGREVQLKGELLKREFAGKQQFVRRLEFRSQREIVDGRGGKRIAAVMKNLAHIERPSAVVS
ncbi:MAG: MGMT family protein [Chitinispirillaceae bacterium]